MLLPVFFALAISTLLIGKNLFFLFFCLSFCSISVSISSLLSPSLVLYLLVRAWSLSLCLHLTVLFFLPLFLSLMPSLFRFLSLILARSSSSPCTLSLSPLHVPTYQTPLSSVCGSGPEAAVHPEAHDATPIEGGRGEEPGS